MAAFVASALACGNVKAIKASVADALRRLDPREPVRYDFALCRLGILDRCPRRCDVAKCTPCLLRPVCRFYNRSPQVVHSLSISHKL